MERTSPVAPWMPFHLQMLQGLVYPCRQRFLHFLYSKEGVTQGDPLSLAFYAISVLPLIRALKDTRSWTQAWYADDASCASELHRLLRWFERLMDLGPDFGYFPEPLKSYVVVEETDLAEANALFDHLGVKAVTSHRFLGEHIGLISGLHEYVDEKVARWKDYVVRIASVAPSQPQDAYVALTKSLTCEWDYLQRVVPKCGPAFEPVEESLREIFLPSLFGTEISETERRLFQLSVKFSGLGIRDPTLTSTSAHQTSIQATRHLVSTINGTCDFDIGIHHGSVSSARFEAR